ncbi:MAG: FAD-dependent oxidoreductase [Eubacteriales bacterium]|nr:FAD-dependent oxidoreductase [Eubacteriales bacterium]
MEKYYRQYDTCRQNEKPFCSNACPFHVDVLDFQSRMENNNYNAAYKTFRNAVGFPDIVAAICPEYCASVCPRGDLDQAVQLNLLEKTCVARATKKEPTDYNVPVKDRKIAVIGAGISGLACALRLTQKKYDVTIYEKTDRLGGKLWDLLPPELFLEEIRRQLQFEKYTLRLHTEVESIKEIRNEGFEAIYIATGKDGFDFHALNGGNGHHRMEEEIAVFAGGSLTGKDPMGALADGLDMAGAIEVFLKTGKREYPEAAAPCRAVADPDKLKKTDAVIPGDSGLFTDEEAAAEARRCIRCQCDACMQYCDVCAYHNKWPMRIRDDIMATVSFSTSPSIIKKTPAKRLMNTCTQCGLCDEVCPENIEIGGMLLEARRSLHKQGTQPGAYHQFWLRDMEFTNSEFAALVRKAPGQEQCTYAFFPGCQLGAADPDYTYAPYKWLLSQRGDTGLLLRCCGVPAEWAGSEELHGREIAALHRDWEQLGKPVMILACPACRKHLMEYLPEIETISLYEVLDQWGYGPNEKGSALSEEERPDENQLAETYSIFDPCTARHVASMEQAVRNLANQSGVILEELPKGDMHGCCGYGGNVSAANADYAAFVAQSRSRLSENPYITYCINCRDIFKEEGKQVLHILDLLFGIKDADGTLPSLSERRRNRMNLKEKLLKEIWGEEMESRPKQSRYKLKFGAEILEKMNRNKILEEDVRDVIEFCEATKRRTYDPEKNAYSGYRESGNITYWAEYRLQGEEYEILNAYTHRMKIKLEGVWNGRKTNIDL